MLNSLGEVLPNAERCFGDKTALVVEGQSFSFRDLNGLSSALAANLVTLGVKPGDRITLYAPNSWEWIVSYYGALKTGAVINPVNVMLTPAEVAYVARDCGAKILIGSPEKIGPSLAAGLTGLKAIVFGKTPVPGTTAFNELVAKAAAFEPIAVDPQALSTIGYTSGTTGHPKGAMQSHRAVILNAAMTVRAARLAARPCRSQRGREAFRLSPHRIVGHDGVGGPRYDVSFARPAQAWLHRHCAPPRRCSHRRRWRRQQDDATRRGRRIDDTRPHRHAGLLRK
jgi:acyl-CoA synthetase (AMP-forming)/AMP-acid ligase II